MASVNSGAKEKAIKSMIDDVFKEFKTSGDFDRFRKEYFVEITSLVRRIILCIDFNSHLIAMIYLYY